MASRAELNRNNLRAGLFVTAALVLTMGVIVVLGDVSALFQSAKTYTVRYTVFDGVENLKPGAEVRIGGVALGRVESIEPLFNGAEFEEIDVHFSVDTRVELFADAKIIVDGALIGADAWLSIYDVGTANDGNALIDGEPIEGKRDAGMLARMLGPESADRTVELISRIPGDYEQHVVPSLENLNRTMDNIGMVVGDVRDNQWPAWSTNVTNVLAWADGATETIDGVLVTGQDLLDDGRGVIRENRDSIRRVTSNAADVSEDAKTLVQRVGKETLERANRLLDRGMDAVDTTVAALERIRKDYEVWSVELDETLANGRLASQQVKLAAVEIHRSPWKLLYRPSVDELEHEMLYEAARSFAMAATDLKAASSSVDRVLTNHAERLQDDPAALQKLQRNLAESFDNYERAQQQLFDVLVTAQGGG